MAVREWIRQAPAWLDVRRNLIDANALLVENLDAGECAAIQLAQGEERALLLMDDAAGRRVADRLGIAQIGTLGILRLAATADLIELPDALNKLVKTNFRVPISLVSTLIAQDAHRRH